jgi:single-strand DNA-binding protein
VAGDVPITVIGNLTADPELKFTPSGQAVANFTVASTVRIWDRDTSAWKDGDTSFFRCNIWRQPAENLVESLGRGDRVIVSGRLKQRSFETKQGEKRSVLEIEVDEAGPSLKWSTVKVERNEVRSSESKSSRSTADSPWGSGDAWSSSDSAGDEPPW